MKEWNSFEEHPSEESMLAAHEGETTSEKFARIRGHVLQCAACRNRLWQLQSELQWFQTALFPPIPESVLEGELSRLRERISDWNEAHPELPGASPKLRLPPTAPVCEWLESELSIYLGLPIARSLVLQACDRPEASAKDLIALIDPVITGFFGRQTGDAVTAQVARLWDRAQQFAAGSGTP